MTRRGPNGLIPVAVSARSRTHPATLSAQRPQIAYGSAIGRPILFHCRAALLDRRLRGHCAVGLKCCRIKRREANLHDEVIACRRRTGPAEHEVEAAVS